MAPYIEAGQRVTGNRAKTARKAATKNAPGNIKAIHESTQANGHDVSDRGRIPATVTQAYAAADQ